jgi:hypothetical protein
MESHKVLAPSQLTWFPMKQMPEMGSPSTAPSRTATSVPRAGRTHAPMWKKWA